MFRGLQLCYRQSKPFVSGSFSSAIEQPVQYRAGPYITGVRFCSVKKTTGSPHHPKAG
jgi:hypothetical protein